MRTPIPRKVDPKTIIDTIALTSSTGSLLGNCIGVIVFDIPVINSNTIAGIHDQRVTVRMCAT